MDPLSGADWEMKYKGRKIAASSLLTILGVVCFATMIVAAVLVTSNTLSFTSTPVTTAKITLTKTSEPPSALVGNEVSYVFNANVANAITSGAKIDIVIAKSGINATDITGATFSYDSGGPGAITFTDVGDTLTATFNVPTGIQGVDNTIACTLALTYQVTGTFAVSATMSGNA